MHCSQPGRLCCLQRCSGCVACLTFIFVAFRKEALGAGGHHVVGIDALHPCQWSCAGGTVCTGIWCPRLRPPTWPSVLRRTPPVVSQLSQTASQAVNLITLTFRCADISAYQLSTASGPQYLQRGSFSRFCEGGGDRARQCVRNECAVCAMRICQCASLRYVQSSRHTVSQAGHDASLANLTHEKMVGSSR